MVTCWSESALLDAAWAERLYRVVPTGTTITRLQRARHEVGEAPDGGDLVAMGEHDGGAFAPESLDVNRG